MDIFDLRRDIDAVDSELIRLYLERMELAAKVGGYKRAKGLPVFDAEREEKVVSCRLASVPEEKRQGAERFLRLLLDESKRTQRRGFNLYLTGMPDCGKTRTAKKLIKLLGLPLADTDRIIMNSTGKTIDEIFDSAGEEVFRVIEAAVLRSVAQKGGTVVALGGGTPLYNNNAEVMKYSGITVFLDRAPEKLLDQNIVNRPLLRGKTREEINERIMKQYKERHESYKAIADLVIDPDAEGAAERIADYYLERIKAE